MASLMTHSDPYMPPHLALKGRIVFRNAFLLFSALQASHILPVFLTSRLLKSIADHSASCMMMATDKFPLFLLFLAPTFVFSTIAAENSASLRQRERILTQKKTRDLCGGGKDCRKRDKILRSVFFHQVRAEIAFVWNS